MALGSSVVLARDFRWRPHYAIPLIAAIFAIAITAATPPGQPFRPGNTILSAVRSSCLPTRRWHWPPSLPVSWITGCCCPSWRTSTHDGRAPAHREGLAPRAAHRRRFSVVAGLALLLPAIFVGIGFLLVFALGLICVRRSQVFLDSLTALSCSHFPRRRCSAFIIRRLSCRKTCRRPFRARRTGSGPCSRSQPAPRWTRRVWACRPSFCSLRLPDAP